MVRVSIRKTNWFVFFERYEISDDSDLGYSINKLLLELQLKRGVQLIYSGDPYEKSYLKSAEVEVSRISSPKSFRFTDGTDIDYCLPKKLNGRKSTKILYNGKFCAEVFYRNNWFKLSEYCDINIFTQDEEVIDKIMFSFMHDYNFNQMYFGT
ncbi:hypothetical protein CWB72_19915 [Pseudoalteromonas phenolica]|uniref:hypothetical protein n=1 Tax=Pseudoalteromonas phenolica TaxID=161398 RepID=UPI00110B43E4|nr:hypothetical protein [Pseudoalteromonas phenolica]TMN86357.1 hypothetical protein CWB72_19915 [Pseudoalteromonas phenolica]